MARSRTPSAGATPASGLRTMTGHQQQRRDHPHGVACSLLLDAFERVDLPNEMTVEDVHLGSPTDPLFQRVSRSVGVSGDGGATVQNCSFDGLQFDGVIYRSVRQLPTPEQA